MATPHVIFFEDLSLKDVPLVGGKNASLGEMVRELATLGVKVPGGFAVTSAAYWAVAQHAGVKPAMLELLDGLDPHDVADLQVRGKALRQLWLNAAFPPDVSSEILRAYDVLCELHGALLDVAVRSSATAEDLPDASFAGQQETYLNIHGPDALLEAVRKCFASLFTDRAISYRTERQFDHMKVALSVGVQQMVRSDLASSGVMFSLDTESGNRDVVLITGAWGLGETVVQGAVNPDEFLVHKPTLGQGFKPIVSRRLGEKAIRMVYAHGGRGTRTEKTPRAMQRRFVLSDDELLTLSRWAVIIENHYTQAYGRPSPMDMEWAKDGNTGELFIVQARPETVEARRAPALETWLLEEKGPVLLTGVAVGHRIGQGTVRVVNRPEEMHTVLPGDVLVADRTDPDWEPVMKKVSAIVTNRGGRTCHAAIVSRELGLPAVVGATGATTRLRGKGAVTVSCAEGDTGVVYEGLLPTRHTTTALEELPQTRTQVMLILANPGQALALGQMPFDGVGLARMEFIINHDIGIHPNALLDFDNLKDTALKEEIETRTAGYSRKADFFVDKLAQGVGLLAAGFYPRPVTLRFSDFKSNEYAGLLGGHLYEPKEENPMIGFRGAARYTHPSFMDAFKLEIEAVRRVRGEMGLKNLKVMVPFCRTVEEGKKVLAVLEHGGLVRGEDGLEVWVMCEIPSNVLLADKFGELFDGFSIGSNDLTQLTLGVDRDSELVAPVFDERNPAVKRLLQMAIMGAHESGRPIGICGQAPSDYPELARFLVTEGINSISLNPDSALAIRAVIAAAEAEMG